MAVVRCAERVFAPGGGPPPELLPLAEPLEQLRAALAGDRTDPAGLRWFARRVVAERDAITWACRRAAPEDVRALGAALAWLSASLESPDRSGTAAADDAWPSAGSAG